MNINKRHFLLTMFLYICLTTLFSQEVGDNSPYGRYGYGILTNRGVGALESMGGISYGVQNKELTNPGNPSSYSQTDSLSFIFNIGFSGQFSKFKENNNTANYKNGNLDYITTRFSLMKQFKLAASIGLTPFSKIGYDYGIIDNKTAPNQSLIEIYQGTGGFNKLYGGLSSEIINNLSIGFNISYLWGNFEYNQTYAPLSTQSNILTVGKNTKYNLRALKTDFGVQYKQNINNSDFIVLGATYSPKLNINTNIYVVNYESDNIIPDTTIIQNQKFQLPNSFGFGITYNKSNLILGADITYEKWKGLEFPNTLYNANINNRFNNRYSINIGGEYFKNSRSSNFSDRIKTRFGLSYSNSYINAITKDSKYSGFKEYGGNLGFGIPFRVYNKISYVNIGFSYKYLNPNVRGIVKQQEFRISLGLTFDELWFFKRKFE